MSDDAGHMRDARTIRHIVAAVAALAGTIERAAADLSLAEEPSNFIAALERAAPDA
jgi:hypothetical protein